MRNLRFHVLLSFSLLWGGSLGWANGASAVVYLQPDATVDNQDQINAALRNDSAREDGILTVHLKKGVYPISEPLLIGSHTVLTGDQNAILKLADGVNWTPDKAMIMNRDPQLSDIVISNFQIDGNKSGIGVADCNALFYDLISLQHCDRLEVVGMYLYRGADDVFRISNCSQVQFHGNIIKKQGGRAIDIFLSDNVSVFGNNLAAGCTDSLRVSGSSDVDIYGNIIAGDNDSAGGIVVGAENGGVINVFGNRISGLHTSGISAAGSGTAKTYIHHNSIFDNQGGVAIDPIVSTGEDSAYAGAVIVFNTIDAVRGPAVSAPGRGVVVQNNVFSRSGAVTGGFDSRGNCFASTEGATANDTVVEDALFADASRHDYHLRSRAGRWNGTSWVVDAESSGCLDRGVDTVFSEPFPNGCKPNPGRYGNTTEASLSGELSPATLPAYPETNSLLYSDSTNSDGQYGAACFASGDSAAAPTGEKSQCQDQPLCSSLSALKSGVGSLALLLLLLSGLGLLLAVALHLFFPSRTDLVYRNNLALRRLLLLLAITGLVYLLVQGAAYLLV